MNYNFNAVPSSCNIKYLWWQLAVVFWNVFFFFFAVMVIGRPARLNLIPQICLAPLTWDHLMRLCPTPDSCSVAFPLSLQQHHPFPPNAADAGKQSHTSSGKQLSFLHCFIGVCFVLNLKLLDQAAFHLWIFGAFCAVKNLWSCIQVYGTLLGGSRVPFLIYELHCIRSVRRLVYSPIIRRFRQLWRHLWYWYWNNTIINLYLYLIFFMFKVSICEICVFASLSLLFFESQLCKCSTIKNVHRITLSSWWGQSEWESGEENGFPHMCEDSLKCGSCSCYTYGPVLEC